MQTDIFTVDRKSEHIFNIVNSDDSDLIKKVTHSKSKPKQKNEYIIYIHNNLYLIIDQKTKSKFCERIENISVTLDNNNIAYVTSKITKMPLESFPIIDQYDSVIKRTIVVYDNGISLIKDNDDNKKVTSFLRIPNDSNIAIQIIENLNQ